MLFFRRLLAAGLCTVACAAASTRAAAQPFRLPTANTALFEPGNEEKFYVGTTGKPWPSGTFGCVRSAGWQFHEGLERAGLGIWAERRPLRGPLVELAGDADG